ncbi:hypothetical protein [Streptomyces sp. NRRL WC-3540]|uniref:hypothetical protein n=1 Tax=Streptomyces sp. NRRL WC-3540 TaxID=1463924 RepID=UPI00067C2FC7|nr:hypothetical protein [Streptomyces sp. NRRL WC-3540]
MLQCTAITNLPPDEALPALLAMDDGPDDAEDLLEDKPYVLCELGEHDETAEHASRLWTAETEPPASLWFLCGLYEDHPGNHSFHITDPLRDAHHAHIRHNAQRARDDDGDDQTY